LRTTPWILILTIVAVLACASSLLARDIHVDNLGGDDRNSGGSPQSSGTGGGPCRTIGRALQLATVGDRIVLANTGEPYRECITLQAARHSGSPERPFVLQGNGATLEGAASVHPDGWQHAGDSVFYFQPARTSFQQLFLDGVPLPRVPVDNNELRLPTLPPFHWCLFERQIYVSLQQPTPEQLKAVEEARDERMLALYKQEQWRYLPQQYDFSFAGHPVGITLYQVRNVVVSDLIVQGYQLDGVNAHDGNLNVSLINIKGRGNGRSGISVGGSSQVRIAESILGDNGAAQVRAEGYSLVEILASDLYAASAPALVREDHSRVSIDGLPVESRVLNEDVEVQRR
jgi:hypothetical protein